MRKAIKDLLKKYNIDEQLYFPSKGFIELMECMTPKELDELVGKKNNG